MIGENINGKNVLLNWTKQNQNEGEEMFKIRGKQKYRVLEFRLG